MNCEQFGERLQRQLDERRDLSSEQELRRHAARCSRCGVDWRISVHLQSLPQRVEGERPTRTVRWAVAAALVGLCVSTFLVSASYQTASVPDSPAIHESATTGDHPGPPAPIDRLRPNAASARLTTTTGNPPDAIKIRWWDDVDTDEWLGQTMPAVRSVRDSVAPLGRSLMKAVALLTSSAKEEPA